MCKDLSTHLRFQIEAIYFENCYKLWWVVDTLTSKALTTYRRLDMMSLWRSVASATVIRELRGEVRNRPTRAGWLFARAVKHFASVYWAQIYKWRFKTSPEFKSTSWSLNVRMNVVDSNKRFIRLKSFLSVWGNSGRIWNCKTKWVKQIMIIIITLSNVSAIIHNIVPDTPACSYGCESAERLEDCPIIL